MAQTISYNLDSLGWMQFESLVQVLLKSELGMGVELWGGSADHGRDAYCASELNFPDRNITNPGPFVFQAKYIAGANATGADFDSQLANAVRNEQALISNRIEAGKWIFPKQYVFLTNAPLTANHRKTITDSLGLPFEQCRVTVLGATDICALLDANIAVARSFPQVLSLRNLFEILDQVVRNEIVQRTDAVIQEADALSGVFVPTKAFDKTWDVLEKHNFVVLEGAPEMGKTAIAWIVAAVMLARKWQAIDCDQPADFFAAYSESREQIFIADDAFGTTEYDVNRGSEWGRQLHKVIPKLNKRHWLIWTSRMHILQKALQEMSLQGSASKFPDHNDILVKASELDNNERALMLYRHARAANLSEMQKLTVRSHAKTIIASRHFTPERIRRFVREALPELQLQIDSESFNEEDLASAIKEAIENPTERMRKAYRQLEDAHRAILTAMLDCHRSPGIVELESACNRFGNPRRPIKEEIDLLKEGFLQDSVPHNAQFSKSPTEQGFDWIHPSYRDLVIEELERDTQASEHFLRHCSWIGLQLALSVAGGDRGLRRHPLMKTAQAWEILRERITNLLDSSMTDYQAREILRAVRASLTGTEGMEDARVRLAAIITSCCDTLRYRFEQGTQELTERTLDEFYDLTMSITPPPRMPSMYAIWSSTHAEFKEMLDAAEDDTALLDTDVLAKWITVTRIVLRTDRRVVIQDGFPESYDLFVERLHTIADGEAHASFTFSKDEEYLEEANRLSELSSSFEELSALFPQHEDQLSRTSRYLDSHSENLKATYSTSSPDEEPKWTTTRTTTSSPALDIDRLFSDL